MNKKMVGNLLEGRRCRDSRRCRREYEGRARTGRDMDCAPKMGRIHRTRTTTPGERLGPLLRWLESHCGRRWDAVYSEICALPPSWVGRDHIKGHVQTWVFSTTGRFFVDASGILRRKDKVR